MNTGDIIYCVDIHNGKSVTIMGKLKPVIIHLYYCATVRKFKLSFYACSVPVNINNLMKILLRIRIIIHVLH